MKCGIRVGKLRRGNAKKSDDMHGNKSERASRARLPGPASPRIEDLLTLANAILVFPADPDLKPLSGRRVPLTLTTQHPLSCDGRPLVLDGDGEVLTDVTFRHLRARLGEWVETDNAELVRGALGVPANEPGFKPIAGSGGGWARSIHELPG
jgi:hypothetical protein